ncbi:MAG: ribonuclease HII [Dehalococcoidales bacterium]
MNNARRKPSLAEEKALRAEGYRLIAGVDEVGRGALMGPVVAAAVIMPENIKARWKSRVRDSKQLTPKARESLFPFIQETAVSLGIGSMANDVIDTIGIARATCLAMIDAINQLAPQPEFLLIDFVKLDLTIPQKGIIDGDSLCFSIACASIIAKVTRDRKVTEMDRDYPGYGFASHKGYGTREHLACLREKGPCPLHRRSFQPVSDIIQEIGA